MSFINARIVTTAANPVDYHRQEVERGRIEYVMSSSSLREFARCPQRWLAGYNPPDSDAKEWGSLLDCRVLTLDQFSTRYAVQPAKYKASVMQCPGCGSVSDSASCRKCGKPRVRVEIEKDWNNNAEACHQWREEQAGKEIVTSEQVTECDEAIERMMQDEIIAAWFNACDPQVWITGQWKDDRTGLIVPVRCLIDFVPRADSEFRLCLGDLKTTRSASVFPWGRHCYEMGYYHQAAFDLDLWNAAAGEDRNQWCFILQENYAPWQTGKRFLTPDFIAFGRRKYEAHLATYCWSLTHNKWPGYDDTDEAAQGWTPVVPEKWMLDREIFAPRFESEAWPETLEEAGI